MLSNEIKAKIFSLYLGCEVEFNYLGSRVIGILVGVSVNIINENIYYVKFNNELYTISDGYKPVLLLRSVKQLTDEECYQIDLLLNKDSQIDIKSNKTMYDLHIKIVRDIITDGYWTFNRSIWDLVPIIDYMRSIAIATAVTLLVDGAVRTVSVQEQIDNNWVQIIKN